MEEEQKGGWVLWILIPVCVVATVMATKWVLQPRKAAPEAVTTEQYTGGNADEVLAAKNTRTEAAPTYFNPEESKDGYHPRAEALQGAPGSQAEPEAAAAPQRSAPQKPAPAPETDALAGRTVKEQKDTGLTYGLLTKAVGRLMNNPKAVSALLNNKYVVNGFMSRDSVRAATANPAALANYLKNPKNMSQFMNKPVVQSGLNNQALFDAVAQSKLVNALLDTPGGKGLLNDHMAMADLFASNPDLMNVISNPKVLNALTSNPKTVGAINQIMP